MEKIDQEKQEIPNIPEYELKEGVQKLIEIIQGEKDKTKKNLLIGIAGGSASGKTSAVAAQVESSYSNESLIISLDDYYKGKTFMDQEAEKGNILNWDQPEALDLDLFKEHLAALKNNQIIEKPIYDMKIGEAEKTEKVIPKKIIITEGLFALHNKIKDEQDIRSFVEIGTHGRILRRLLRDVKRTGQKPSDILKYFSQVVEPMHEKYVQSSKDNAQIIIRNEYNPKTEAKRSGLNEIQLKFKGTLDENQLNKLGAKKISTTNQIDYYYNPKDRDLLQTGEILRIRDEGSKKTLGYKGPQTESSYRERAKFEFEIDQETEEAFLKIYGEKRKTIIKNRTIYSLEDVFFSIDKVKKIENDQEVEIGDFIEIRSTNKQANKEKINLAIKSLKLNIENGIKKSYFEM